MLISYRRVQSGVFCVWSLYTGWPELLYSRTVQAVCSESVGNCVFRDLHLHWKIFGIHKQKMLKNTYTVFQMGVSSLASTLREPGASQLLADSHPGLYSTVSSEGYSSQHLATRCPIFVYVPLWRYLSQNSFNSLKCLDSFSRILLQSVRD